LLTERAKAVRILVVDDEPEVLEFFEAIATRMNLICDTAADGQEALSLLSRDVFYDVCFIDFRMPTMDGVELTRTIVATQVHKPVIIIISAYDWNTIERDAKEAGVDSFLAKPLFASDVIECLGQHIGIVSDRELSNAENTSVESFEGHRVLLVEDIEINRIIVQTLLEPTQLEIECAVNGAEAVRLFSADPKRYNMILMDMQMPVMNGLEATRQIRALDVDKAKEIPIVAMTANVFREDIERCLEAGMNDHIGKPIDLSELMAKLKQFLQPQQIK